MTGTALDMTSPRLNGAGPVYAAFGELDPTAATLTKALSYGLTLMRIPLDVLLDLETGRPTLRSGALAAVAALADRPLIGAVGFDDWWNNALSMLNPRFPLAAARQMAINKAALYARLAEEGATTPEFISGPLSETLIKNALDHFGPSPIFKPITGAGSRGVYRYREELSVADNLALYRQFLAIGHIDSGVDTLAAPYLGGRQALEISVDIIVCAGTAIHVVVHEKLTATRVHPFVDRIMISPPANSDIVESLPLLPATVAMIIAGLGVAYGALHVELRLHEGVWHVLDVGVRPGSGLVAHSVQAITGVDPRMVHLAASIGRPVDAASAGGGSPSHSGVCIACCYIRDPDRNSISFARQAELARVLRGTPDVLGWHLNASEVVDQIYRADAGLSIGLGANTSTEALQQLWSIIEPFNYTTS